MFSKKPNSKKIILSRLKMDLIMRENAGLATVAG